MICELPGGYLDDEERVHREVELVAPGGREEELLASTTVRESASLVTELIGRCVIRIGTIAPVTAEVAGRLLTGDRQFLLLKLRELTFGDRVEAVVHCPYPQCGAKVDIDFSLHDVPVRRLDEPPRAKYATRIDIAGRETETIFRLPNGHDQVAVAPLLQENEAAALSALLERCVLRAGEVEGPEAAQLFDAPARLELERCMEDRAPAVSLHLDIHCRECERAFALPFHFQDFFFGELRIHRDLLHREVHYLAFHYHWSEAEIMALPREKRRQYIETLSEEIERINDAI